ncbi:MAG: hypothetical protein R3C26_01330 [Calditrichia bacterium]
MRTMSQPSPQPPDSSGVFTVKFTVTDPGNLSDTDTIAVTIASINDAPVIAPAIPDVSFPEDGSTTVALNDYVSDADHSDAQLTWTAQVLTTAGGSTAVQIDPSDLKRSDRRKQRCHLLRNSGQRRRVHREIHRIRSG